MDNRPGLAREQNEADAALIVQMHADYELLLEIAEAAQEYRRIALADPTSLDRPPAGSRLDAALARLPELKEPR